MKHIGAGECSLRVMKRVQDAHVQCDIMSVNCMCFPVCLVTGTYLTSAVAYRSAYKHICPDTFAKLLDRYNLLATHGSCAS